MSRLVGDVFSSSGHQVSRLDEQMDEHEVDGVIWAAAIDENVVVVTFDRDFRAIATHFPFGQRGALKRRAGLISLSGVHEPTAAGRVATLMTEIEFAHERAVERRLRFIMGITATL